eukprot:gnl/TRDRNA2_/TRDRNA2_157380_c1_seq1.p2 gnl/TRDRNA2_/TRDRNA2_157380_c1~~gnl/TRDRNA2_/TRDRNA2_157380_c1_seq1.p2  ORF type:complete len:124 (-),score=6.75 gnl/TRDRNA2_/TRDRNA2_157380_c1_seq1:361-732(-)
MISHKLRKRSYPLGSPRRLSAALTTASESTAATFARAHAMVASPWVLKSLRRSPKPKLFVQELPDPHTFCNVDSSSAASSSLVARDGTESTGSFRLASGRPFDFCACGTPVLLQMLVCHATGS